MASLSSWFAKSPFKGKVNCANLLRVYEYTFGGADEEIDWNLYVLSPSEMYKHHSLYFCSKGKNTGFIVHILASNGEALLEAEPFDIRRYQQLQKTCLGSPRATIKQILTSAYKTMKEMGYHSLIDNSCQDFCSNLSKKLGCSGYMSDATKTTLWGFVAAAATLVVGGAAAYAYSQSGQSSNDREEEEEDLD